MGYPAKRLDLADLAERSYAAMIRWDRTIDVDPELRKLVKIRISQINGCAFCIDMHWKQARAAGMSEERLYSLSAWREAELYSARERAALALAESVTLVAETGVPDDVYAEAAAEFSEEELAELIMAIASMNTLNRIAISSRMEPGHFEVADAA